MKQTALPSCIVLPELYCQVDDMYPAFSAPCSIIASMQAAYSVASVKESMHVCRKERPFGRKRAGAHHAA